MNSHTLLAKTIHWTFSILPLVLCLSCGIRGNISGRSPSYASFRSFGRSSTSCWRGGTSSGTSQGSQASTYFVICLRSSPAAFSQIPRGRTSIPPPSRVSRPSQSPPCPSRTSFGRRQAWRSGVLLGLACTRVR